MWWARTGLHQTDVFLAEHQRIFHRELKIFCLTFGGATGAAWWLAKPRTTEPMWIKAGKTLELISQESQIPALGPRVAADH